MTVPPEVFEERRRRFLTTGFGLLLFALAIMWAVEFVDSVLLSDQLQENGILPREVDGLDGILWAPFLHGTWAHLLANSLPLLVLGGLVAIWGARRWLVVTLIVMVLGGAATWALARFGNHIGASGLVFGYFGFLVGAVFYERKIWPILLATVAILLFGSAIVSGVVPTQGVSWEGHVFGGLAGLVAAKVTTPRDSTLEAG